MQDNPSQTLEEARRLLAASLHAEPSSSFSNAGDVLMQSVCLVCVEYQMLFVGLLLGLQDKC